MEPGLHSLVPESFDSNHRTILRQLAIEYMPWENPDNVLGETFALAIRLLNDASFEAVHRFENIVGTEYLRKVMREADPILFNPASWSFWHLRLGIPKREQPKRCQGVRPLPKKFY